MIFTGGTIGSTFRGDSIGITPDSGQEIIRMYEKEYGDADRFDLASPFTILSENLTPDRLNELLKFLKNTDSPGFGLKASDSTFKLPNGKTFYGQFEGKNAKDGFEKDKNFDAISGATITSNGVANLLKAGTETLLSYIGGKDE